MFYVFFLDMQKFESYLEHLNRVRPSIQFTYELSRITTVANGPSDFPDNVVESIPFLELNVMRLSNGNFTFSIYRKPCHAGHYLHAFSYQPRSHKSSVIRSQYLRAYRYCDKQFLKDEEESIRQSFLTLGYTRKFIEECRTSAYKGRRQEIQKEHMIALQELPFAINGITTTKAEKNEPLATITLPYHPRTEKLKPRLNEMGIRLAFNSNSTLRQQLRHNSNTCGQPKGSVYVINCTACTEVYVGQTGRHTEDRMREHARGPPPNSLTTGAITNHNSNLGHRMDTENPTQVFFSDCNYTRSTVESALMHAAPTIQFNTVSASNHFDELVAPVICRSTKFNWENLSKCIPHMNKTSVPWYKRYLFGTQEMVGFSSPPLEALHIAHRTRSRLQAGLSSEAPNVT